MYNDGLTRQQRYYQRNKEKLTAQRRAKYHNNPEVKEREIEYTRQWKKAHPYETSLQSKRHRERVKAKRFIDTNDNVD